MKYTNLLKLALCASVFPAFDSGAQGTPPVAPAGRPTRAAAPFALPTAATPSVAKALRDGTKPEEMVTFAMEQMDLDLVMEQYCEWTDKIYLKTDDVKASITLRSDKKIPVSEAIKVVDAILAMNNIALVPMGDNYIKVIQATAGDLTGQGTDITFLDPDRELAATDNFITTIIQLKNVTIPEVQAAIQHVLHAYGKILTLERSNSIMITDTEANIKRARELIDFIDQATVQIEPKIYQIQYAEASDIASKINEIVAAAQGDQKTTTQIPTTAVRTPAGVIRASSASKTPTKATVTGTESTGAVIIEGTVKVMSDERTNIIIIFSLEKNFAFFDKIIKVLDVEVEPATTFEVIGLEYADAVDISGTINDLIGAASSSRSSGSSRSSSSASRSAATDSSTRVTPNALPPAGNVSLENLNRLSEDTKVLADERTNSILLMGSKHDIAAIKQLIKSLDIMLEQVVIEAAIFEIGLTDSLRHGIDWLYQASDGNKVGAWDGTSLTDSTNGLGTVSSSALTYYQNITGINTELAISLAASDSDAKLISTPVIMTTDNTEATLSIGEQRPVVTSTSSYANSSGTQSSTYEYKDIGIQLTVTPRINPQRFVVMEVNQTADQLGGTVTIDDNDVPIILNREFSASIAVPDGGTVVLGGLVSSEMSDSVTKIPLLGDIPFLGRYLFSSVYKEEVQRELIVLMTPYVMTDMNEMSGQTRKLYKGAGFKQEDWGKNNWSQSKLRDIPNPIEGEEVMNKDYQPTQPVVTPETVPAETDAAELIRMMDAMGAEQ
ncbi:type II secretion system secretin GspD [Pontiella sp.]|uniref:type II secretion system secretin GspD n=1 Tax=Pontiella sp. TaxID=2837462 RepID=UPI0035646226